MKRIITLLLAFAMLLSLAACGSREPKEAEEQITEKTEYAIGFSAGDLAEEFTEHYANEFEAYLKSLNTQEVTCRLTVQDAKQDADVQLAQIEELLGSEIDVLMVSLIETSDAGAIEEKAAQAGIPVIFVGQEPDEAALTGKNGVFYVGTGIPELYAAQGKIVTSLENRGDWNGDGQVGCLTLTETENAQKKAEVCMAALKSGGITAEDPNCEKAETPEEAEEICTSALKEQGEALEIIFCHSDALAAGALRAIEAADRTVGKDICLVGMGASADGAALVKNGEMTGTVRSDYLEQAHKTADLIHSLLAGETPVDGCRIDAMLITK